MLSLSKMLVISASVLLSIGTATITTHTADSIPKEESEVIRVIEPDMIYEVEPKKPVFNEDEYGLVCRVVMAEARGEGIEGMMAVTEVIQNRAELWEMSLTDVCLAEGQFTRPYSGEVTEACRNAVDNVLVEGCRIFPDHKPIYFHAGEKPYWADDYTFIGQFGNHYFYE